MRTLSRSRSAAILCLALPVVAVGCGRHAEPEVHLIPKGYVGHVHIIFGASDGNAPQYEGGARLYVIPATGFLRTPLAPNLGWSLKSKTRFFAVDSETGQRTELGQALDEASNGNNNPLVFGRSSGVSAAAVPGTEGKWSSEAPCAVRFLSYFVGRRSDAATRGDGAESLGDYLEKNPLPCEKDDA